MAIATQKIKLIIASINSSKDFALRGLSKVIAFVKRGIKKENKSIGKIIFK
jgi:hypothetical protein